MNLLWTTAKGSTDMTWLKAKVQVGQISQEEEETCYLYTTTLVCPWNYCSFITSFTSTAPKPNTAMQSNWSITGSTCYKTLTSVSSWQRVLKIKHKVWGEHLIHILSLSKWHGKRQIVSRWEGKSCKKAEKRSLPQSIQESTYNGTGIQPEGLSKSKLNYFCAKIMEKPIQKCFWKETSVTAV